MNEEYAFDGRDEFNRKPFAEFLVRLLLNEQDFFPLAITGPWGTGKTEFCKKAVNLINREYSDKLVSGYLNAFAEDRYNDSLISILSSLYRNFVFDGQKCFVAEEQKKKALVVFGEVILSHLPFALAKVAVPQMEGFADFAKDLLDKFKHSNVELSFEDRANLDARLDTLKNLLKEISGDKTFVLFIDELDRCRPNFALQTLETIKHVFGTEKLKIIFVINKDQLVEIIKHSYGNNEEIADLYLDKFFQVQLKLSEITKSLDDEIIATSVLYFDMEFGNSNLFDSYIFNRDGGENSQVAHLLRECISRYRLSLRDVQKLLKYVSIYSLVRTESKSLPIIYSMIEMYAVFQFAFNKKMYRNYKIGIPLLHEVDDMVRKERDRIPASFILYNSLTEDENHRFHQYVGASRLEDRKFFLKQTFFRLENLFV